MCEINNVSTTLPYGPPITLRDPDKAYQSLAIDLSGQFNKSDGYTSITIIMDLFNSNTHLMILKHAATPEKIFEKLKSTILDVHRLPLSIVRTRALALPLSFGYK